MRYLPKSPADRVQMLGEIGVKSIDDLFSSIPAEYRITRDLNVPRQMAESEIIDWFRARAGDMTSGHAIMLGAGAYQHYRPVIIDSLISRGEFLTSYTPYQAEIAQGTLQSIFEFQTMICELTGMDVANASLYDASTGVAEGVLMAARLTGRMEAVVARTVNPQFRQVLATTIKHQNLPVKEAAYDENGRVNVNALDAAVTEKTACVVIQSPNFFGTLEDIAVIADLAHKKGALLVVVVSEAVSLGIVKPPVEADIVVMDAQSFGVPLGFGGPYCGVLATKEKNVRQMPGRLIGQAFDKSGRRGFVLALSTREQHIRRDKATSNICTNQGLMALVATIYMCIYGREGMRELAQQNLSKADFAAKQFAAQAGAKVLFGGTPRFNEFVVQTKDAPSKINERLRSKKIVGGLPLTEHYPELGNATLWCCTETVSKENIETAAKAVNA